MTSRKTPDPDPLHAILHEPLHRPREAAFLLGRPVADVRAMARRELRALRIDKVLRFHPSDVRRLAAGRVG